MSVLDTDLPIGFPPLGFVRLDARPPQPPGLSGRSVWPPRRARGATIPKRRAHLWRLRSLPAVGRHRNGQSRCREGRVLTEGDQNTLTASAASRVAGLDEVRHFRFVAAECR